MLIPLTEKRRTLHEGSVSFTGGSTSFIRASAGEGGFRFDHLTIGFVLNRVGSHKARYGQDRITAMPLEAGMGWILPAGVDGYCSWTEANDFINLSLGDDTLAKVTGGALVSDIRIASQIQDPMLVQLALNLHESGRADDAVATMYRDTMGLAVAAHVARAFGGPVEAAVPAFDARIRRAMDYIEEHKAEEISLETLAGIAAMSPFHFARSFKSATGLPPHKYLAARRMEMAKQLLKSTTLPVVEIAFRTGYENVSHFTQVFRQHVGTTPGAFRAA